MATFRPSPGPRTKSGHPRGRQPQEAVESRASPGRRDEPALGHPEDVPVNGASSRRRSHVHSGRRAELARDREHAEHRHRGGTAVAAGPDISDQSLGELVATATRDLSLLVHKEIELAKTELSAEIKRAGIGAGFLGGAGFTGVFALLFLSVTAALGIAAGADIPVWSGFLIVGAAYGMLAGSLAALGLGKVTRVGPPQRTIRTVKDDITWAKHPTVAPDPELDDLRASHGS